MRESVMDSLPPIQQISPLKQNLFHEMPVGKNEVDGGMPQEDNFSDDDEKSRDQV